MGKTQTRKEFEASVERGTAYTLAHLRTQPGDPAVDDVIAAAVQAIFRMPTDSAEGKRMLAHSIRAAITAAYKIGAGQSGGFVQAELMGWHDDSI